MAAPGKPLQIIGRELLVPLRISGTWKCPAPGTGAMVLLPTLERSVVVRLGGNDTIPNIVREVFQPRSGKPLPDGPLCWRNRVGTAAPDDFVRYHVVADDGTLPKMLTTAVELGGTTDPAGSIRGMWRARLLLSEEGMSVALARKVAPYAEIQIWSSPKTGRWAWMINRLGRWYSEEVTSPMRRADTLKTGIEAAFAHVQVLVAEACVAKDTGRRAAFDVEYAAKHPRKERKKAKDKVAELAAKPPKKRAPKRPTLLTPKYGENRDKIVAFVADARAKGEQPMLTVHQVEPGGIAGRGTQAVKDASGKLIAVFTRHDQADKGLRVAKLKEGQTGVWTGRAPAKGKKGPGTGPPTVKTPPPAGSWRAFVAERMPVHVAYGHSRPESLKMIGAEWQKKKAELGLPPTPPKKPNGAPTKAAKAKELKASAKGMTQKGWTFDRKWDGAGWVWRRADKSIALRLLPIKEGRTTFGGVYQLQLGDSKADDFYFMPGEMPFTEAERAAKLFMSENTGKKAPASSALPVAIVKRLFAPKGNGNGKGNGKKGAKDATAEKDAKLAAMFKAALAAT